jgi:hypothetical protein
VSARNLDESLQTDFNRLKKKINIMLTLNQESERLPTLTDRSNLNF